MKDARHLTHQVIVDNSEGTGWREIFLGGSPEAEAERLAEVMPLVGEIQRRVASKQSSEIRRGFHNKGNIIKLSMEISKDLPAVLQTGFLQPGNSYPGVGRFSRSQSKFGKDKDLDQRGFAFRIRTPDGPQDFLLSNTPVSFAEDPITFLQGGLVFASHGRAAVPFKLIQTFGPRKGIRILRDILGSPDRDLSFTCQRYWTRTAFQINEAAVRFTVVPSPEHESRAASSNPDGLSQLLLDELREGPKAFTLNAQFFVNETTTPIENANQAWRVEDAPLVPFATVHLPQQDIDSDDAKALAETLEKETAFNPWTTPCIHPLGAMNRARREAYKQSALHRGGVPHGV